MGIFKRRPRGGHLSAAEMLQLLSGMQLRALLQHDTVWLAVDGPTAGLLDACCTGALDGGPGTAAQVVAAVGASHPGEEYVRQLNEQLAEQWVVQQQRQQHWMPGHTQPAKRGRRQQHAAEGLTHSKVGVPGVPHHPQHEQQQQQIDEQQYKQQPGCDQQQQQMQQLEAKQQPGEQQPGKQQEQQHKVQDQCSLQIQAEQHARGSGHICSASNGQAPAQPMLASPAAMDVDQPSSAGAHRTTHAEGADGQHTEADKAVRLSPEEAFFLHHVLGCLQAYAMAPPQAAAAAAAAAAGPGEAMPPAASEHGAAAAAGAADEAKPSAGAAASHQVRQVSTDELWRWCSQCASRHGAFAALYGAYLHLRAKGWLPRSGLLYGADYVVYALHPSVVHSEFVVQVVPHGFTAKGSEPAPPGRTAGVTSAGCANGSTAGSSAASSAGRGAAAAAGASKGAEVPPEDEPLLWIDVQIAQRLARQVFKRLLLLHVAVAPGTDLASPSCLDALSVREVLVRRWVANINREDDTSMAALED